MGEPEPNTAIQIAPRPEDEVERVLELEEMGLDYTRLKKSLDDFSKLAAHVAGTEISLINLIDSFTQWSVSTYGIELDQMPREDSVCQYTILEDEDMEVKSLKKDERFSSKDYVISGPNLNYYYGIPLTTSNGHNVGVLCVLDQETKDLTPEKIELLRIIAKEIVSRLELIGKINRLKENLEDISELPRKVLHDIRGPIGGILGLSKMIKGEAEEKELDDIISLIELIQKGGKSVLELADEILDIQDGDKEEAPGRHEFNLVQLQEKLQQLFEPQATSKGVSLDIQSNGSNQKLPFPKHKLLQIIGNLTSNAIKFTPESGNVTVKLNLMEEESGVSPTHLLNVTVEDDGTGMSQEQVEKIRNKDIDTEQYSTKGTGGEKGYGFGIRLVKHLVKTLNGEIQVSSSQGEGTEINVSIPLDL